MPCFLVIGLAAFSTREVFGALKEPAMQMPLKAISLIGLAGTLVAGFHIMESVIAERNGQDYATELRLILFQHLSHLPFRSLSEQRAGGLSLRFVGDLASIRSWVLSVPLSLN